MTEHRLDLSPLDPATDAVRWERMLRRVAIRGAEGAARRRQGRLVVQLAAWMRPALALAAAAVLVAWAPTLLPREHRVPVAADGRAHDQASRLAAWASGDRPGTDLLAILGDDDDSR